MGATLLCEAFTRAGSAMSLQPVNSMSSFSTGAPGQGADLQENVYKESCFPIDYSKAVVKTKNAAGKTVTKTVNMNLSKGPAAVAETYQSCVMKCVPGGNKKG